VNREPHGREEGRQECEPPAVLSQPFLALRLVLLSRPRPRATAHLAGLEDFTERGDDHLGVIGTRPRTVEAIRRWAYLGAAARLSRGVPTTPNGLALCKIHHAAYDQNMLGVSPDYKVSINREVLAEVDGPMLKHGLQEMHARTIMLSVRKVDRPDRELLAWRWERLGW
jgi:hypothetical protein